MAAVIALCASQQERASIRINASGPIHDRLPCAAEKQAAAKAGGTAASADWRYHDAAHEPLTQQISDELTSSLQCSDLLCKISYTTLVPIDAVFVTPDHSVTIVSFASGFVSFVPAQLQRPPIT